MRALVGHLAENAKQVVGRPLHIDKVESKNEIWRRSRMALAIRREP